MAKVLIWSFFLLFVISACKQENTIPRTTEQQAINEISSRKIVDLTHPYSRETVYWVNAKEFKLDTVFNGQTDKGYYYSANNYSAAEHGGTHIDAPIHFAEGTQTVEQIPLEKLVGAAIKIDVSANVLDNPEYLISIENLKDWETREGTQIPDGSIVLLRTGFSKYYPKKILYMGTADRGDMAITKLHFPGLSPEAAQWLVENRNINAIGIDTPSIDYGQSKYFKSHVILLSENIPAFENLANLDQLPNSGFDIVALPMKIQGGTGAPLRIIAMLN